MGWYRPYIADSRCPTCGSIERTRLLLFALESQKEYFRKGTRIVHFAPEKALRGFFVDMEYVTADLYNCADVKLNIESIDLEDASVDVVIANHVLEHVNDHNATREVHRVLRPGGRFFCMVPMVEGWEATYEDPSISRPLDRKLHFGQEDHLRLYGRDFTSRVRSAGFDLVEEYCVQGSKSVFYRLNPGEKVFIFERPGRTV